MNDRAIMALALIFAVAFGVTIFWLGTKQGAERTKDGFQIAYGGLVSVDGALSMLPQDEETEAKRQIGFRPEDHTI